MQEKFDFSKIEEQERFSTLPEKTKEQFIAKAMEEAEILKSKIESGEAKNYEEALQLILSEKERKIEKRQQISGEKGANLLKEQFDQLVEKRKQNKDLIIPDLNWRKYAHLLYVEVEKDGDVVVDDLSFAPRIPLLSKESREEYRKAIENIINNSFFEHSVGGWTEAKSYILKDVVQDIERSIFKERGGFYVTPTFCPWKHGGEENTIVVYFNEHLMELMTPSVESLAAINKKGEIENIIRFQSGSEWKGYWMAEAGYPDLIVKLLAKRGRCLSFYNDVLGVLITAPVTITNRKEIIIGPIESELQNLLSYDNNEKLKGGYLKKSPYIWEAEGKIKRDIIEKGKYVGKAKLLMPIQRLTPGIISGIIEYDTKSGVAKRIAIPFGDRFKIYNEAFEEQRVERRYTRLTREELAQQEYSELLRRGQIRHLIEHIDRMRIEPKFKEEDVQEGYRTLVESGDTGKIFSIFKLQQITGVQPEKEIVQLAYKSLTKQGRAYEIKKLYDKTKIKPVFEESDVQQGYVNIIKNGWLDSFDKFKELTGIAPTQRSVQNGYTELLRAGSESIGDIPYFSEVTGVKPNFTEKEEIQKIQNAYRQFLEDDLPRVILDLKEATGIAPKLNKDEIHKAYERFKEREWSYGIEQLEKATGIKFEKKKG